MKCTAYDGLHVTEDIRLPGCVQFVRAYAVRRDQCVKRVLEVAKPHGAGTWLPVCSRWHVEGYETLGWFGTWASFPVHVRDGRGAVSEGE